MSVVPTPHPVATKVDAVVFDCDGLLVDTESCWTRAEKALFEQHGLAFGLDEKKMLIGRTPTALGVILARHFGRPGDEAALTGALLGRVQQEVEQGVATLPGAVDLVRACAARVPVAVASNSPRPLLRLTLESTGLAELLPVTVSVDDVAEPKPAPDIYLAACAAVGAVPDRSVAFEDSHTGLASAQAAGLSPVFVPSLPDGVGDTGGAWHLDSLTEPAVHEWAAALVTA
ncbi:HAD family hydrolase [Actinomycetota bacterium Odt1-20B]